MTSANDRNGNRIELTESGIASEAGDVSIAIARDQQGRITSISDSTGDSVIYLYTRGGDLASVIDRGGNTTKFQYRTDKPHFVDNIIDSLGRPVAKTTFDADGRILSVTTADGSSQKYSYNTTASSMSTQDPLGNSTIFEYDSRGNVTSIEDALGGITRSIYNSRDLQVERTDPIGRTTRFEYDSNDNLTLQIDPRGGQTHRVYDAFSTLISTTDQTGQSSSVVLDSKGNVLVVTDPMGYQMQTRLSKDGEIIGLSVTDLGSASFAVSNGKILSMVDSQGTHSSFQYDVNGNTTSSSVRFETAIGLQEARNASVRDENGRVLQTIDPLGNTTRYTYDSIGNMLTETDALGRVTQFRYDKKNRLLEVVYPDGLTNQNEYDLAGRLIRAIDRSGRQTQFRYDAIGRRIETLFPDDTPNNDLDNPSVKSVFDAAGQLVATIDEKGNRKQLRYDGSGNLVETQDALGHQFHSVYDISNRLVETIDAEGYRTSYTYDSNGNRILTDFGFGEQEFYRYDSRGALLSKRDSLGEKTEYEYSSLGQLTAVIDPLGNRTSHDYDSLGRRIATIDALGRATVFEYDLANRKIATIQPDGATTRHFYDSVNQLIREIDANGDETTYRYDPMGRVVEIRRRDETILHTYTPSSLIATTRDNRGLTQFEYDARDRLTKRIEPDNVEVLYTYDAAGNQIELRSPSGATRFEYDANNRQTAVVSADGQRTQLQYDSLGRVTSIVAWNSTIEDRTYDTRGRLVKMEVHRGTELQSMISYTLDVVGRRVREIDERGSESFFEYDANGRLHNELHKTPSGEVRSITHEYDSVGNRISKIDSIDGTTIYVYNSRDQLTRDTIDSIVTNRRYDANGNLIEVTSGGNREGFDWDAAGRLRKVTSARAGVEIISEYLYDADGNRVEMLEGGQRTRFILDTSNPLARVIEERSDTTGSHSIHTYGPNSVGRLSWKLDNNRYIVHRDAIQSTRMLTDSSGSVVFRANYDGFGQIRETSGTVNMAWLFAGELRSRTTGLDYLRARNYDPVTSRFISSDPFAGHSNDPMSLHRYQYSHLNPISNRDPSGKVSLVEVMQTINYTSVLQTALFNGAVSTLLSLPRARSGKDVAGAFFGGFALGAAFGLVGQGLIAAHHLSHAADIPAALRSQAALQQLWRETAESAASVMRTEGSLGALRTELALITARYLPYVTAESKALSASIGALEEMILNIEFWHRAFSFIANTGISGFQIAAYLMEEVQTKKGTKNGPSEAGTSITGDSYDDLFELAGGGR